MFDPHTMNTFCGSVSIRRLAHCLLPCKSQFSRDFLPCHIPVPSPRL